MKITRRQKDVIVKMLQLYFQLNGRPLHYTELAEFIGVNRFTAYDMLKVLEEKGLVQSRYRINDQGHGRSEVVFEPTQFARDLVAEVEPSIAADQWEEGKNKTLQGMPVHEIGQEVLGRILPTDESPNVQKSAEFHAALLTRLQKNPHSDQLATQLARLVPQTDTVRRSQLTLLSGMWLGLLANTQPNDDTWWNELLEEAENYQQLVLQMDTAEHNRLAEIIYQLVQNTSPDHTHETLQT